MEVPTNGVQPQPQEIQAQASYFRKENRPVSKTVIYSTTPLSSDQRNRLRRLHDVIMNIHHTRMVMESLWSNRCSNIKLKPINEKSSEPLENVDNPFRSLGELDGSHAENSQKRAKPIARHDSSSVFDGVGDRLGYSRGLNLEGVGNPFRQN